MESLVPARLTTEADADRLTRVAKGYLEKGMNRRNKTFVPPPILFLLKRNARAHGAAYVRRSDPELVTATTRQRRWRTPRRCGSQGGRRLERKRRAARGCAT